MDKKITCPNCGGTGREPDLGMSVAMGAATGIGFFPGMTKICSGCNGQGEIEITE